VAWETAQTFTFDSTVGVTERFASERQKLQVAFAFPSQRAFERTAPVMATSSGDRPRPATSV
jgi:hypothetical protein